VAVALSTEPSARMLRLRIRILRIIYNLDAGRAEPEPEPLVCTYVYILHLDGSLVSADCWLLIGAKWILTSEFWFLVLNALSYII
jgi:hypothetical protein